MHQSFDNQDHEQPYAYIDLLISSPNDELMKRIDKERKKLDKIFAPLLEEIEATERLFAEDYELRINI